MVGALGDSDGDGVARNGDLASEPVELFGHDRDVKDLWDVGDLCGASGQQGERHELEGRVLSSGDGDLALKAGSALDPQRQGIGVLWHDTIVEVGLGSSHGQLDAYLYKDWR